MSDEPQANGVTGSVQSFTKNWREPVQFVTALVALVAGAKGIVVPKAQEYLGVQGPAIIVHDLKVSSAKAGGHGVIRLHVDKVRNCKLSNAAFLLTDMAGNQWPLDHGWRASMPPGIGMRPTFQYDMPHGVAPGAAAVSAIISYESCTDGGKMPPTVTAQSITTVNP